MSAFLIMEQIEFGQSINALSSFHIRVEFHSLKKKLMNLSTTKLIVSNRAKPYKLSHLTIFKSNKKQEYYWFSKMGLNLNRIYYKHVFQLLVTPHVSGEMIQAARTPCAVERRWKPKAVDVQCFRMSRLVTPRGTRESEIELCLKNW